MQLFTKGTAFRALFSYEFVDRKTNRALTGHVLTSIIDDIEYTDNESDLLCQGKKMHDEVIKLTSLSKTSG
jgi:hypothetical protein